MQGRRTARPCIPIPCPSKALGSPSWQGKCPIDSEELEIGQLLPAAPLYDPPEARPGKPHRLTPVAADLTFCFSQRVCEPEDCLGRVPATVGLVHRGLVHS